MPHGPPRPAILGQPPLPLPAAVAAECANEQGRYWEYHDILFENQNSWAKLDTNTLISTFSQYAGNVGLAQEQFDSCLETGKYLEEIQQDLLGIVTFIGCRPGMVGIYIYLH